MKKLAVLMVLMLTVMLLTGCQASVSSIEEAKLDESYQIYEDIMGPGAQNFDLVLGKGIKKIYMNLYQLENGAWVPLVNGIHAVDKHRERSIVCVFEDHIALRYGDVIHKVPIDELPLKDPGIVSICLDQKTELLPETEVPVFLYIKSSPDRAEIELSDFYAPEKLAEHERVYVLTVMVSQEEVK